MTLNKMQILFISIYIISFIIFMIPHPDIITSAILSTSLLSILFMFTFRSDER